MIRRTGDDTPYKILVHDIYYLLFRAVCDRNNNSKLFGIKERMIQTAPSCCQTLYTAQCIEQFIEDQAFSPSCNLASPPRPPSPSPVSKYSTSSVFLWVAGRASWRERWGSQIIRRRESLVLHKLSILSGMQKGELKRSRGKDTTES